MEPWNDRDVERLFVDLIVCRSRICALHLCSNSSSAIIRSALAQRGYHISSCLHAPSCYYSSSVHRTGLARKMARRWLYSGIKDILHSYMWTDLLANSSIVPGVCYRTDCFNHESLLRSPYSFFAMGKPLVHSEQQWISWGHRLSWLPVVLTEKNQSTIYPIVKHNIVIFIFIARCA